MAGSIYFGNTNFQTWIEAPQTNMKASAVGWSTEQQLLNGRAFVRRSQASHRRFEASWLGSLNTSDITASLNTIKNFADGVYGTGPYYFIDPYAISENILPPHWAMPALAENDWPDMSTDLTPTFSAATYPLTNNYPAKSAIYTTTGAYAATRRLIVIIPTGYTLHFGWHSTAAGSTGVRITPYTRAGAAGTSLNPVSILSSGTTRFNTTVSGTTYGYVEIYLATAGAATVTITGMMAQLSASTTPTTGDFIMGKGTTGLEFTDSPDIEYYTAALNNGFVGMSATWVEV